MYLILRPLNQARILYDLLQTERIKVDIFPIMDFVIDQFVIDSVIDHINDRSGVLFISPSAIDIFSQHIHKISSSVVFFTVGQSSKRYLAKLTTNLIVSPQFASGINALIDEKLLISGKIDNLVIIGGDIVSNELQDKMKSYDLSYKYFGIYQRVNCGLDNLLQFKEFFNDDSLPTLIITSKIIVEYLMVCLFQKEYLKSKIATLKVISIHPQISKQLKYYGFCNVYETANSSNQAILEVVRKLEHE